MEKNKRSLGRVLTRRQGEHMTPEEREYTREKFLEALCRTGNLTRSCLEADVGKTTVYQWVEHDEEFAQKFHAAQEIANDVLRNEAWRRGVEGVEEPVVSMGKLVYDKEGNPITVKKYSDQLLMFTMRARMSEYRDKTAIEHSGSIDYAGAAQSLYDKIMQSIPEDARRRIEEIEE